MRPAIILTLLLFSLLASAQTQVQTDSIVQLVCEHIIKNNEQQDSIRIQEAYQAHLYGYVGPFDAETQNQITTSVYMRLQRNCPEFYRIISRLYGNDGDWKEESESLKSKLSKKECKQFFKRGKYWYLEGNGDQTYVQFDAEYWTDTFTDGTTSKLHMHWNNTCEFQIEFIESNNLIRKNFSRKGDRYNYTILELKDNYYEMLAEIPEKGHKLTFKMYFENEVAKSDYSQLIFS